MKTINVKKIVDSVSKMCITSNCILNNDIYNCIKSNISTESSPIGVEILNQLIENADIAKSNSMPICQDTGMAIVFVELGQEVYIQGGLLEDAINDGVKKGYNEGYLRKSVVSDPFFRENTLDNTPAIIHYSIVSGENLKITFVPKGFGSENMSKIFMLKPSDGILGAKKVILETIEMAGPNACPPMIVGVGIGGNFEKSAILAKKALLRPIDTYSNIDYIKNLEIELLKDANKLGIGPQGLGGNTTLLGINIETFPTHIAGLPVAINISCHVTRHSQVIL